MQQLSLFDFGEETPKPEKKKKASKKADDTTQSADHVEQHKDAESSLSTPGVDHTSSLADDNPASDEPMSQIPMTNTETPSNEGKSGEIVEENSPVPPALVPPNNIIDEENQMENEVSIPIDPPTSNEADSVVQPVTTEPQKSTSEDANAELIPAEGGTTDPIATKQPELSTEADASGKEATADNNVDSTNSGVESASKGKIAASPDSVNEPSASPVTGSSLVPPTHILEDENVAGVTEHSIAPEHNKTVEKETEADSQQTDSAVTTPVNHNAKENTEGSSESALEEEQDHMDENRNNSSQSGLPSETEVSQDNADKNKLPPDNEQTVKSSPSTDSDRESYDTNQEQAIEGAASPTSNTDRQGTQDVVFSDEKIIVKFKPKASALPNEPIAAGEKSDTEAPVTSSENYPPTQLNEPQIHLESRAQVNNEDIDTSFPPVEAEKEEGTIKEDLKVTDHVDSASEDNDENANATLTRDSNKNNSGNNPGKEQEKQVEVLPIQQETSNKTQVNSNTAASNSVENDTNDEENVDVIARSPSNSSGIPVLPGNIYTEKTTENEPELDLSDDGSKESPTKQDNIQSEENLKKVRFEEEKTPTIHKRGRKSFKEIDAEVDLIDVPSDEELYTKQYYPISVVAKWFRVNNSLLRFWENEFKILKPKKNKKGDRFFRPEDVKNLQVIYYLLRQKKLTISGAIKHLNANKEHTEVNLQLIKSLNDFKGFLLELRATTEK